MSNILSQDTFQHANQSGWPSSSGPPVESWSQVRGSGTLSISSNEGVLTFASATTNVMTLGTQTPGNCEVLVRCTQSNTSDSMGACLHFIDSNNFYAVGMAYVSAGNLYIRKDKAGTFSSLNSAAFTTTASTFYWIRARITGSSGNWTISGKIWADGSNEPSAWTLTATDSSSTNDAGKYGISSAPSGTGNTTKFDSLTVTDASKLLSVPVRSVVRTQVTKSLPVRVLVRTQQTKSLPIRALVRTQQTVSAPIRSVIRTLKTLSLPMRTLVRTQVTKSLPVRSVVRTLKTVSLPIRTVVSSSATLNTLSLRMRTRVRTLATKSVPIRTVARTLHTLSLPMRSVVRTLKTVSLPVRTGARTQRTLSLQIRSVVRGRTLSLPIRTVVASLPPTTVYMIGYGRDGTATGHSRDGSATGKGA